MKKKLICYIFLLVSIGALSAQNRIFVNQKAAVGGDGKSWATAFNALQIALQDTLAKSEIWIAEGTYFPTDTIDRMVSFVIPSGYKIYGGFKGNEISLQQRDWEQNKTILSGDIGQKNNNDDNSYCVVELNDVDSTTILDGLTVSNGNANNKDNIVWSNQKSKAGGGLRIISKNKNCKPQLLNCSFSNNTAQGYGGGVYVNFEGSNIMQPLFYNCGFENNTGGFGGGISIKARLDKDTAFFDKCYFKYNQSKLLGTAINIDDIVGERFVVENCNFNNNKENYACIHIAVINVDFLIDNSVFRSNKGGLLSYEGNNRNFTISNSYFDENSVGVETGYDMFAIANAGFPSMERRRYLISNCVFNNNRYRFRTFSFLNRSNDEVIFDRVKIKDNASLSFLYGGKLFLLNSIFYKPKMEIAPINAYISNVTFIAPNKSIISLAAKKEIIFKNNILITQNTTIPFFFEMRGKITISNLLSNFIEIDSLEKNFEFGLSGADLPDTLIADKKTIFKVDPKFQDIENFDYRLLPCSPAINAGTLDLPSEVKALLQTDLDGKKRVVGNAIDIGAYEYQNDNNLTFSAKIIEPSTKSSNGSITIENMSGGTPPYQYAWSNGAMTQAIKNLAAGTYTITITDQTGCTLSQTYKLTEISSASNLAFANVYLYPNPSNGLFYLQNTTNQSIAKINIYNTQGVLLQENYAPFSNISLTDFPNGLYFYQFQDENNKILKSEKLILFR
jgi:hypothetical protein